MSVSLAGELDLDTVAGIEPALTRLAQDAERGITLDLTDVTFCDSPGVALFFCMHQRCLTAGVHLSLSGIQRLPARVIRALGVDRAVPCTFA
ncbi:STAS domain-containing protein [Streptomyces sp. NPDC054802]